MTLFDGFVVGSMMLSIGWFLGAIYVQNQNEETHSPPVSEKPEKCSQCEAWRFPAPASAAAD